MASKDEEFQKKLLSTFKVEANDRMQKLSSELLALEKGGQGDVNQSMIESIYRELHSLKSAARAVNLTSIESICQRLESTFAFFKKNKKKPAPEQFDLLYKASDIIERLLKNLGEENLPLIEASGSQFDELINHLLHDLDGMESLTGVKADSKLSLINSRTSDHQNEASDTRYVNEPNAPNEPNEPNAPNETDEKNGVSETKRINKTDEIKRVNETKRSKEQKSNDSYETNDANKTIRISASKLDGLLVQSEEMLSVKYDIIQRIREVTQLKDEIVGFKKELNKYNNEQLTHKKYFIAESNNKKQMSDESHFKIQELLRNSENKFKSIILGVDNITRKLEQNLHDFTIGVDNLLEDTKKLMLWPFSTILNPLPRMVRDLSRSLGKSVDFRLEGTEVEIDKRILEEIKDVLTHLIRNSIDHGIEKAETRRTLNKPETGLISIQIQHMTGNEIQIEIKDDGAGINAEAVKKSALSLKIISPEEAENLSYDETLALIYQSGVTTSKILSNLSGRGLGMSIIREKMEKVGGKISIKSSVNNGTTTKITLPLTLATFRGLLIQTSNQNFIIPISNIERIMAIHSHGIKNIENKETIVYDSQVISLVWLSDILGLQRNIANKGIDEKLLILILASVDNRVAFVVDEILNEHEILVKNFSKPLTRVRNIAASAILDAGRLVPILNVIDLLNVQFIAHKSASESTESEGGSNVNKQVLLVEDSITTRMFLKNVLELDGFQVTTAVDGLDAWEKLKGNHFSILVSDIEMPRMNGFELTEKVRKDKHLKEMPIVLVTSRETQNDRERGIDLGANAYILKSTFDSKHLTEVVKRLSL